MKLFCVLVLICSLLIVSCLPQQDATDILPAQDAGVATEDVPYFENANGFLARPTSPGTYPGIVMIHEWWGLNDNIKDTAKKLAAEGYVVLAVDLYGEVAQTPEKARELSSAARANPEKSVRNMKAAVAYLKGNPSVNPAFIGSLGWCFGGGMSLQLSLNEELDATVIYYGSLVTNSSSLLNITWPVLGIFGDQDTSIPPDTVKAFESALDEIGTKNEIYLYEGVGHAFANPTGANYAPEETKDAWEKTTSFLDRTLKPR